MKSSIVMTVLFIGSVLTNIFLLKKLEVRQDTIVLLAQVIDKQNQEISFLEKTIKAN